MWWIELNYGFYLQYPAYFPRISLWIVDKYSSISFWQRPVTEFYGKKALNIIIFLSPPLVVILFCLFLNHIVFTYWLVSICLYCRAFTPSRGVVINVFLEVTIIRLTNKNDVIVQIGYFTAFWKENIHGNKYVNYNIKKKHEVYLIIWNSYFNSCFLFCFVLLESSGTFGKTPNAFIFSLNHFKGLAPFVSKVKGDKTGKAIHDISRNGPTFGQDLVIYLDAGLVQHSKAVLGAYYSVPASVKNNPATLMLTREQRFLPDEVEVFHLDPSMQDNTNWVQLKAKRCI